MNIHMFDGSEPKSPKRLYLPSMDRNTIGRSYGGQMLEMGDKRDVFCEHPRSHLSVAIYEIVKENTDVELNDALIVLYNVEMDRVRLIDQNRFWTRNKLNTFEKEYLDEIRSVDAEQDKKEIKLQYKEKYRQYLAETTEKQKGYEREFYETIRGGVSFF